MPKTVAQLEDALSHPYGAYRKSGFALRMTRNIAPGKAGSCNRLRRSLAKSYLRRSGKLFDAEYRDLRLRLLPRENACDLEIALYGKYSEEDELLVYENILKAGDVVVDIGANIGIYALTAAQHIGPEGRVLAFEPHPRTLAKLRRNIALNDVATVTVLPKAVADQAGTMQMQTVSHRDAGRNSLLTEMNKKGLATVDVEIVPLLDELKAEGVDRIDILKIDVEGFEDRALWPFFQTAPRSLWPHYMMAEVAHAHFWKNDFVRFLLDNGYETAFENPLNRHLKRVDVS